jgi:hypothetical protein
MISINEGFVRWRWELELEGYIIILWEDTLFCEVFRIEI